MERVLTVEQMRAADLHTINTLGVPEEVLVERAGRAVVDEIFKRFRGGRVLVCVGKGNNGKDGEVIANILSKTHGFSVAKINIANGIFKLFDNKYDIIVDCIFGTGLNKVVEGRYREAIEKINRSGAYVVSCDIPSGLNGNTGLKMGISVHANLTVAIQEFKLGHFLNDGPDYCGETVSKDIGISIWGDDFALRINTDTAKKYFLKRKRNTHKGSYGCVALIGGSKSYFGSALLSEGALSSLKAGVGYSYLYIPESLFSLYAGLNPECIISTIKDDGGYICFDEQALTDVLNRSVIAIGMGIGQSENVYKSIKFLLENYQGVLLIDADGLNSLSAYGVGILKNKKCKVILTPHVGEFSRLIGEDKNYIKADFIESAKKFAEEYNVCVVLKSATTIITDGEKVFVNTTGNTSLAKAGSGDVLSGFTAGVLSRADDIAEGAAVACYIFGRAAEIATSEQNEYVVTASDVIASLGSAINSL